MKTVKARYDNWRLAYPRAFLMFEKFANEAKAAGFEQYSPRTLAELVRWHGDIEKVEDFKLNNNYIAYMARELIAKDPSFAGFFALRRMK